MPSAWGNVFATVPQRNVYAVTALADLKNLTPPTGDATVSVDYRAALGDGLGDLYSWNAGDIRADNGTTIIQPNSAPAAGRWNAAALGLAFALGAGTVAAPALTFGGDASSGFYRPAANQIGVSISGVQKALFSATGIVASGAKILINGGAIPRVDFAPSSGNTRTGSLTQQGDSLIFASDLANLMALNLSTGNVSGVPTFTATTSIVAPLVGTITNANLGLQANGTEYWDIGSPISGLTGALYPIGDATQNLGGATHRINTGFFGTSVVSPLVTNSGSALQLQGPVGVNTASPTSFGHFAVRGFQTIGGLPNSGRISGHFSDASNSSLFIGHPSGPSAVDLITDQNLLRLYVGSTILGLTVSNIGTSIVGTNTNDNAATGNYGEYVSSTIATGASVALTTAVSANITSITLGAGDWDVSGCICFTFGATTSYTNLVGGASATSATLGNQETTFDYETPATVPTAGKDMSWVIPEQRFSLNGSTTIFLVVQGTFTVSTLKAYGIIRARRVR